MKDLHLPVLLLLPSVTTGRGESFTLHYWQVSLSVIVSELLSLNSLLTFVCSGALFGGEKFGFLTTFFSSFKILHSLRSMGDRFDEGFTGFLLCF